MALKCMQSALIVTFVSDNNFHQKHQLTDIADHAFKCQ